MFCENCGAKLEEDARFCGVCGTKVTLPEPAESQPAPENGGQLPLEEGTAPAPEAVEPEPAGEPVLSEPVPEPVADLPPQPVVQPVYVEPPQPVAQPVYVEPPQPVAAPAKRPYRPKSKPHIALRIPLQILSFILCLVLAVSLVGTVLLADLNLLMSAGGIKQLINAVLLPTAAPCHVRPAAGALGVHMDDAAIPEFTIPGDLDISDIPSDLLNGEDGVNIDGLVDWIYNAVEEATGEPLPVSKDQVQSFIAESTVSDFVSEKLAGYAEDFINGTETTTITTQEILDLLEENQRLMEEKFQVEITPEVKDNLSVSVENAMAETDLNAVIREQVFETVKETIDESMEETGLSWEQLQPMLQTLCSDSLLYIAIGSCLVLMLLLCLLNFYNIPGGMTWSAVPCIFMGGLLTAPLVVLQASPDLFADLMPKAVTGILASFAGVLMPIHSAVLFVGLGLLIVSIIWRAIRGAVRRSRLRASVA